MAHTPTMSPIPNDAPAGPRRRSVIAGTAAALAAPLLHMRPASAQQAINCTFISGFPPAATFVASFLHGYVQAVDGALAKGGKYKINWNMAHSGQVAKPRGEFEAIQGGLGDIAVVPTPYFFDRVPMYEIPFVTPFTVHDAGTLSRAFKALEDRFPKVYQDVWTKYNQKLLSTTANADAYVIISKKQIRTLDDMKGMKIGGVGSNLSWVQVLGAAPVQGAMSDFFTGLNTGLYDAAMTTPQSLSAFKLCQPAKFLLEPGLGANGNINLNVNLNYWNRLPPEVRTALADAAPVWNTGQVKVLEDGAKEAMAACTKDGMVVTRLSDADRAKWAKTMPNFAQDWAARMEKQNIPGREILRFYMDYMRSANQKIARQWDRE